MYPTSSSSFQHAILPSLPDKFESFCKYVTVYVILVVANLASLVLVSVGVVGLLFAICSFTCSYDLVRFCLCAMQLVSVDLL